MIPEKKLRLVFMGTPEFAKTTLETLIHHNYKVVGVVTMPDKPAGRGLNLVESPVKQVAVQNQIPVLQPEKLKNPDFIKQLLELDADLFIVVAFRMLPEEVWSMPRIGTINLHASLLPHYRGAAPINHVIMNGETETGVTTFFIEKEIDTGKIIFCEPITISPTETAGELHDRLMSLGAQLITKTIDAVETGIYPAVSQANLLSDGEKIKLAPKIFKDSCRIDWNNKSQKVYNFIRGLSPYPAAWFEVERMSDNLATTIKVFESEFIVKQHENLPGTIITDDKSYLNIACTDGFVHIKSLQAASKKRLPVIDFLKGTKLNGWRIK